MLHLFKKVYLATDNVIDVNVDRIVISEKNGVEELDVLKAYHGNLHAFGSDVDTLVGTDKKYSSTVDMFDKLGDLSDDGSKKVVIYADDKAFNIVFANWCKLIFKTPTKENAKDLLESLLFKYKVFHRGRYSNNAGNTDITHTVSTETFNTVYDDVTISPGEQNSFIEKNKAKLSIEYQLATYLNDGSYKPELKATIQVLIKQDLEKYLYELKEIFFAHLLTKRFTDKLSLAKTYTWSNYADVESDTSKYADLFMKSSIWKYKYMNYPSVGKNIDFSGITADDVTNFKEFTTISGSCWGEEGVYTHIKSDVNKLDFLDILTNFTDARLTALLDVEASFENAAGSFFSIDLETVNHYLIQSILDNKDNTDFLSKYTLK